MINDEKLIYESYGTIYRGNKTEQDSKDYGMNLTPYMHIIMKLSQGTFDTDSEQDTVSKGELQGIFDVDTVHGHRQVVLTNDAVQKVEQIYPELKGKFWECGKCKADYAACSAAKQHDFRDQMPDSREEYSAHDYAKEMEMRGEDAEENQHPLGNVRDVQARDLKPGDVLSLFKNTVIKIDDMAPRLVKGKVRVTYKDIRGVTHNVDWNKGTKISVDNASQEDEEQDVHPYHGPLTNLGDGYYWAAEEDGDTDDQWYNFFLLKQVDAGKNHYKFIRSFIKIRDYDSNLTGDDSNRIKAWLKKHNVIDISSEDEEGDLMKHMKDKGMIDAKATDDTGKYGRTREEEEHYASEDEQRRLDPKCWKGYHKSGTKTKSGVRVNNCVKN